MRWLLLVLVGCNTYTWEDRCWELAQAPCQWQRECSGHEAPTCEEDYVAACLETAEGEAKPVTEGCKDAMEQMACDNSGSIPEVCTDDG